MELFYATKKNIFLKLKKIFSKIIEFNIDLNKAFLKKGVI